MIVIVMKKIVQALSLIIIFGLFSFLSVYIGTHNMGVLNPKGVIAVAQKDLIITSVVLMMIVIIPVFIMLFSFAWRYRASNTKAKYTPDWHSNLILEIIWWTVPVVIVVFLAIITWKSSHDLDPFKPLVSEVKPVVIEVVALDWKWLFIYPEEHIATVNFLEIPMDTPIHFKITSDAPMNAFWIPQLGSMIYAMAGMTAQLHLMADEVGVYKGLSSNFSGDGFSGMKFDTKVVTGAEYVAWLNEVRTSPQSLTEEEYKELIKPTKNHPVVQYSSVRDDLYSSIIMKYMAPHTMKKENPGMNHQHSH